MTYIHTRVYDPCFRIDSSHQVGISCRRAWGEVLGNVLYAFMAERCTLVALSKLASFTALWLPIAALPSAVFSCARWLKGSRCAGAYQALELSPWNSTRTCLAQQALCKWLYRSMCYSAGAA